MKQTILLAAGPRSLFIIAVLATVLTTMTACGHGSVGDNGQGDAAVDPDGARDGSVVDQPEFVPGDFGSLTRSPGRNAFLVRLALPGDLWVEEEFRTIRPRLLHYDTVRGELQEISHRAASWHRWPAAGGLLFIRLDEPDEMLMHLTEAGEVREVLPGHRSARLNHSGTAVIAQSQLRRDHVYVLATGDRYDLDDEVYARAVDREASCVVLERQGRYELWQPGDGSLRDLGPVGTGRNWVLLGDCAQAVTWDASELAIHDLVTESSRVVTVNERPAGWYRFSPDDRAFYYFGVVAAGRRAVYRVWLETAQAETLYVTPGEYDGLTTGDTPEAYAGQQPVTPDGRYWLLNVWHDIRLGCSSCCYTPLIVDLVAGEASLRGVPICPEVYGGAFFSEHGTHLMLFPTDLNGWAVRVEAQSDPFMFCTWEECLLPGRISPAGTHLVAAWTNDASPAAMTDLMVLSLNDPGLPATRLHQGELRHALGWYRFVHFSADGRHVTHGRETLPHPDYFGDCPVELRATPIAAPLPRVLGDDVLATLMLADDTVVFVTGAADPVLCPAWQSPTGFQPGLHMVPRSAWIEP